MKYSRTLLFIFLGAVLIAALLTILLSRNPSISAPPAKPVNSIEARASMPEISPVESGKSVAPLLELDTYLEAYESETRADFNLDLNLKKTRENALKYRADGGTAWGSENWMKSPEYYAALETPDLGAECFDDSIFYHEMAIHNEPRVGFIALSILHDGFAELLRRDDMWRGLISAFNHLASQLNPESDLETIVRVSGQISALSNALLVIPELQEQVRGHEREFFEAMLSAVRSFKDYTVEFDPERAGSPMPFFGEPTWVARSALVLLKQLDQQQYYEVLPGLDQFRMSQKQDLDELRVILDVTIEALETVR
jgi:hypothetical protein